MLFIPTQLYPGSNGAEVIELDSRSLRLADYPDESLCGGCYRSVLSNSRQKAATSQPFRSAQPPERRHSLEMAPLEWRLSFAITITHAP